MVDGTSRQCKRNWNICHWFCSLQNGYHLSCFKGEPHPEWSVRGEKCGVGSRENGPFFAWVSTLSFAVIGFILPHSQILPSWGKKNELTRKKEILMLCSCHQCSHFLLIVQSCYQFWLKRRQRMICTCNLLKSYEWPRVKFSWRYQYNIKQTSDENKEEITIRRYLVDPIPNSLS